MARDLVGKPFFQYTFPIAICCASAKQNFTSPSHTPGSTSTSRGASAVSPIHRGSSSCSSIAAAAAAAQIEASHPSPIGTIRYRKQSGFDKSKTLLLKKYIYCKKFSITDCLYLVRVQTVNTLLVGLRQRRTFSFTQAHKIIVPVLENVFNVTPLIRSAVVGLGSDITQLHGLPTPGTVSCR